MEGYWRITQVDGLNETHALCNSISSVLRFMEQDAKSTASVKLRFVRFL